MELSYLNNIDDSIEFARFHLATDPEFKKRKKLNLYIYPLGIFVVIGAFSIFTRDLVSIIGGVIGGLIAYIWNWVAYLRLDSKLVNHIRGRKSTEVHCLHTLTISSEGVTEKTAESQNFQTWKAIGRVSITPTHIYIYNTPITAHIIPLREVGDAVFQDAVLEISKYRNQ